MTTGRNMDAQLKNIMKKAAEFHGHLGPFLVIGVRMGLLAKRTLNSDGFSDLSVTVNTGSKPPLSCVADGIQVATGCTLGKGNIAVRNLNEVSSIFATKRRTIQVKIRRDAIQSLALELLHGDPRKMERTAIEISLMPDTKLFSIEES